MKKTLLLLLTIVALFSCTNPTHDAVKPDTSIPFEIYQQIQAFNTDSTDGYYHIVETDSYLYVAEKKDGSQFTIQRKIKKDTMLGGEFLELVLLLIFAGILFGILVSN